MAKNDDNADETDLIEVCRKEKHWNIVRVYRVHNGKRSGRLHDFAIGSLPTIRDDISKTFGPGEFDLELTQSGTNSKGMQVRISEETDRRSPAAIMSANAGNAALVPTNVYPGGAPMPPPWAMMPPPWAMQQGPSAEVQALKDQLTLIRAEMSAQRDNFMQQLMRDLLLERHKAGNVMLTEQKETFKQAFELGRSTKNGAAGGSWSDPQSVLPVLDRASKVVERWLEKKNAPQQQQQPTEQQPVDHTAMLLRFCTSCIKNKVPPKAAIEQLRAIVSESDFKSLLEQRGEFAEYFLGHDDVQPLLADAYATQWVREAATVLDELANPKPPPQSPDEVLPPNAPPPGGAPS